MKKSSKRYVKNKSNQKNIKKTEENIQDVIEYKKNEFKERIQVQEDARIQNFINRRESRYKEEEKRNKLLKAIASLEEQEKQQDDEEIKDFFKEVKKRVDLVEQTQKEHIIMQNATINKEKKEIQKNKENKRKNTTKRYRGSSLKQILSSEEFDICGWDDERI